MNTEPTILVLDDDPGVLGMLEVILTAAGYRVIATSDYEQAIRQINLSPPDVVLLDWMIPGYDGGELCRWLKANPNRDHVSVVMMSCDDRLRARVAEFGADGYILKPFEVDYLLDTLRMARRKRPSGGDQQLPFAYVPCGA